MERTTQRIDRPAGANPAVAREIRPPEARAVEARVQVGESESHFWRRVCDAALRIHRGQSLRSLAFALVNEGRALVECDRISLLVPHGRHFVLEAVSGQEDFDARSHALRNLTRLANTAARLNEPLWWHEAGAAALPARLEAALADYRKIAEVKSLGLLPLPGESGHKRPCGLLVVERFTSGGDARQLELRSEVLTAHAAIALHNRLESDAVIGASFLRAVGKAMHRRTLVKFVVAAAVLAGLTAIMFIPADFRLEARGVLQPTIRQEVFAPVEGVVTEVHVEHGDQVRAGMPVMENDQPQPLLRLRNLELEMTHTRARGEKAETLKEVNAIAVSLLNDKSLSPLQLDQLRSRKKQLQETLATLDAQIELIEKKISMLDIYSPIDGKVSTLDVRQRLIQLPVDRGQPLFSVSDLDSNWELNLQLPEDRMGHLRKALDDSSPDAAPVTVTYRLTSEPGSEFNGKLVEVGDRADLSPTDHTNVVRLLVSVNREELPHLREGAGVVAKINCGRRALGFVLFHDVVEFAQRKLFW